MCATCNTHVHTCMHTYNPSHGLMVALLFFYYLVIDLFVFRCEPCILCNIKTTDEESIHTLSYEDIILVESELSLKNINTQSNLTQYEECLQAIVYLKEKFAQFVSQEKESMELDGKRLVNDFLQNKGQN